MSAHADYPHDDRTLHGCGECERPCDGGADCPGEHCCTGDHTAEVRECLECGQPVDTDVEGSFVGYYGDPDGGGWMCEPCHTSMLQGSPTATLIEPDDTPPYDDGRPLWYLTPNGVFDRWLEEVDPATVPFSAVWRSSGWRGWYDVAPTGDGWESVASGWTTGDFGDATAASKQAFNRWAESVYSGDTVLPCPVWFVVAPTSNVFSTTVDVYVPTGTDAAALEVPNL
jgi:hypothetical protein